jgi:recombinational DNA repair protein (RecF pathway)
MDLFPIVAYTDSKSRVWVDIGLDPDPEYCIDCKTHQPPRYYNPEKNTYLCEDCGRVVK